jgi:tripartite-type tricarboxylate transporter receptor subunit TctC
MRRHFGAALGLTLAAFTCSVACAQSYPTKPVRIVTAAAGGSNDSAARLIGRELTGIFKQQVIVDNRAGWFIPGEIVARAPPDGYTLLFYGITLWIGPLLRQKAPYDPIKDFAPITLAVSSPNVLVVNPSVAAASVKELIALAKARSGELNYGSGSAGASAHLAAELFKSMAGVNIVWVPYKGAGPSLNALIANEVQLSFPAAASGMPHVKSGRLRALAVTSAQPSALTPGLPTMSASGLPGFESSSIVGMFAPGRTPLPLINRLNADIVQVLATSEVQDRFLKMGVETVGSSPEQLSAAIKSEVTRFGKVIRDAGIRAE